MSKFPHKQFQGEVYTFDHLDSLTVEVPLNSSGDNVIKMTVTFGCHCFTEKFEGSVHSPDYSYRYRNEIRAFNVQRYVCSLQLPNVILKMLGGTIYHAGDSYTYAAQLNLGEGVSAQSYSVFFSLERDRNAGEPALRMFVKSAYLKPLVTSSNAQNWRFKSLAGQISGAFQPKAKKPRPTKKKAPKGLIPTS